MSSKSVESAIRDLTKMVSDLRNKISTLEKVVLDQNNIIKKLIDDGADLSALAKPCNIKAGDGGCKTLPSLRKTAPPQETQRPLRNIHVQATPVISTSARRARRRNISPAFSSVHTETHEPKTTSTSLNAPSTESQTTSTSQLDFANAAVTAATTHTHSDEATDSTTEWVGVRHRKHHRVPVKVTRGTAAADSNACALSAAERKSYLHLYFVQVGTTSEQVLTQLHNICPDDNCDAETLKSRGDYASFKLTVPAKHLEKYLAPEHWPEDVHIKPWRSGFRKPQQQASQK